MTLGRSLVVLLAVALHAPEASATWSIAAVDPETQEVGVAVASCVPAPFGTTLLPQVAGLAPGIGALAAQAQFSQARRDQAVMLLASGLSPQEVIDMVTMSDPQAAVRQYGVVTLDLQLAAFTGTGTQDWAGDAQGRGVTAQGNILYGPQVVDDALAAFEAEAPRCPWTLSDRLMLALEAGAAQGGDNRCSMEQTALAAALRVAAPGDDPDAPMLDLRIPSQPEDGDNPVVLLRAEYDRWRQNNPPDDSGCDAGTDSTGEGGASTSEGAGSSGPAPASTGEPATTGPRPPAPGSSDGGRGSGSDSSQGGGGADDGGAGCGCRHDATTAPGWTFIALLLGWRRTGGRQPR